MPPINSTDVTSAAPTPLIYASLFNQLHLPPWEEFFLTEAPPEDLIKVVHGYVKLGFKLNLPKLIEMSHQDPKITMALKLSLDFWNLIGAVALDRANNINKLNWEKYGYWNPAQKI